MSSDGSSTSSILFQGVKRTIALDKPRLRAFAARLPAELSAGQPFTVLIANDKELHRLYLAFLQHDYPTDVLSFPGESELGEMAISADRALEQAASLGQTAARQERFGPYQLVRRIGQGGMGVVLEAIRTDDFHKKVP